MNFEEWLQSRGFDPTALSERQRASLLALFEEQKRDVPVAEPVAVADEPVAVPAPARADEDITKYRREMSRETVRVEEIRRICSQHENPTLTVKDGDSEDVKVSLESYAIEQGWNVQRTELEALRQARPKVQPRAGQQSRMGAPEVIEAALCMTLGMPNVEKVFRPEVLEAAHKTWRNIGLQQLLLTAAAENGYTAGPGTRIHVGNIREVLSYAFPGGGMRAGFSTVSLPGILGNVANKELLMGYMEEDQTWREISVIKPVMNFHAVTSYRMLDNMEYEEIGAGGEIKHGTVDQESYTRQARTYAKMFSLTRTDIINDDLGAFDDLRTRLGRGAGKKFNNLFWTNFLNNASFFTAGRGNYIVGATSTLLVDGVGLQQGITAFRILKSPTADGAKRIGGRPELLLVPPELEFAADRLYQSTNVNTGGAATAETVGNANIHANKYRPVVVPWLSDSAFTGYSATAWYLFRSPRDLPAMVVSFLNGQQAPTVESAEADFNVLGVLFRGYHDFGCDLAEYLCGIKSKGAA